MTTINIQKTFYKIGDFISWQKSGSLVLTPDFQRRSVWRPGAKSFFIDTIVRGFPIPIIFLRDQRIDLTSFEPKREIIDGQQRLRTVISFISPELLPDFDPKKDEFTVRAVHNKELANKKFKDLSQDIQRQILEYQFNVHVLPSWVDDRDVLQIFRRMNSTNYPLTPQELRNAAYFGLFKTLAYDIAAQQLHRWRKWRTFTEDNIARMLEVELTSEFLVLMLQKKISGRNPSAIDGFYERYDSELSEKDELESRFNIIMDTIDDKLGSDIQHSPFGRKTVIYSLFAYFYDAIFGLESDLTTITPQSISPETISWVKLAGERIQNRTAPDNVLQASDRRTTNPIERNALFSYLKNRS